MLGLRGGVLKKIYNAPWHETYCIFITGAYHTKEPSIDAMVQHLVRVARRVVYEPGAGLVERKPRDPYDHDFSGFFSNAG